AALASTDMSAAARADIEAQLDGLIYPGFLAATPPEWQPRLSRYLHAVQIRLRKLSERHPKDAEFMGRVQAAAAPLAAWRERLPADWPWPPAVIRYRWLLEEFRVSLFAQHLGTATPVSERRL